MMTCFECGEDGHLARDCPNVSWISGTGGDWCGYCDERTRLIDQGDTCKRCTTCHPNRTRQLAQHRKCSACNNRVYSWDNSPCWHHQEIGPRPHVAIVTSGQAAPRDLRTVALAQAAESRAQRLAWLDVESSQDQHQDPAGDHQPGQHAEQQDPR